MVRAGIHALAAEDATFLHKMEFEVFIERKDFTGADADAGTAVHALALVERHTVFEYPDRCTKARHPVAHQMAGIIGDIDECLSLG